MDNLPNWLLPFWIIGAPVIVLIFDHMRTSKSAPVYRESPATSTDPASYERP